MRAPLLGATLLLVAACSSGNDFSAASTSDAGTEGSGGVTFGSGGAGGEGTGGSSGNASPRHFRLATVGEQLLVTGPDLGLQLGPAHVAEDSDVIGMHHEVYGIPWDAFETQTPPPPEWTAVMNRLASAARATGKPVFLSVSMLDGMRQRLADRTRIENGAVKTTSAWSADCYDFATATDAASKAAAYRRYVEYMVQTFEPAYLNIAIEVNLFFEKCPAASPGLIDVANATYDAVKAAHPTTVVFPSFQLDHLYGYARDACPDPTQRAACFDAAYAVIAPLRRDRFAMSTYPYMNEVGGVAGLPVDWFTRAPSRAGERGLIAETGWLSTPLVALTNAPSCYTLFTYTEADAGSYVERVLADAESANLELVTWWSNQDLVVSDLMTDCPCTFDPTWCTVLDVFRGPVVPGGVDTQLFGEVLLKAFGTMGLRDYAGIPKPAVHEPWRAALARPFTP